MSPSISRRSTIAGLAALLGTTACAGAPETSIRPEKRQASLGRRAEPASEALVRASGLSGIVGFAVIDVATGRVLEERAASAALPPASVAKAMTALYALETLGAGHQFVTRVVATGGVSGGVAQGDLILVGGGDPVLDTDALAVLARRLKEAGIRQVNGKFRVWGGALPFAKVIDPDQPDHVGYNPAVSGLNLNFNRVHFEWKRASGKWRTTMDARSKNYRPDVRMARMTIAQRSAPIYTYKDGGSFDQWSVASGALGKGGARWLPVRKPELYAGEVFRTFAASQGISLSAPEVMRSAPKGETVVEFASAPLGDLARDMLKYSTNLTAEALGLAASVKRKGNIGSLQASAREMSDWARGRFGLARSTRFADHSGLSDDSRITAIDMAKTLQAARKRTSIRALMKDIKMLDENRRAIPNHPVKVQAKTGTLNFVSSLAGYATAVGGRELAFAIFIGDTSRRASIARADRERPAGASSYNRAAKGLQQRLLQRWGKVYPAS